MSHREKERTEDY